MNGEIEPSRASLKTSSIDSTMWTAIRNVDLRVGTKPDEGGSLRVRTLRGRVFETRSGQLPFLDDPDSFGIEVTSGTVALDGAGLTTLLTERVFNYHDSPIRSLRVTVEDGQLVQVADRYVPAGGLGDFLNTNPLFNFLGSHSSAFVLLKEKATLLAKGQMVRENLANLAGGAQPGATDQRLDSSSPRAAAPRPRDRPRPAVIPRARPW